MDEIENFFRQSKRIKPHIRQQLEWWEDSEQEYVIIYAMVASRIKWQRIDLDPNQAILCPTCSRFDHWKLGGHPKGIVMICEHEPIVVGTLGIRNVTSLPIRFIRGEELPCGICGNPFKDCICENPELSEQLFDKV